MKRFLIISVLALLAAAAPSAYATHDPDRGEGSGANIVHVGGFDGGTDPPGKGSGWMRIRDAETGLWMDCDIISTDPRPDGTPGRKLTCVVEIPPDCVMLVSIEMQWSQAELDWVVVPNVPPEAFPGGGSCPPGAAETAEAAAKRAVEGNEARVVIGLPNEGSADANGRSTAKAPVVSPIGSTTHTVPIGMPTGPGYGYYPKLARGGLNVAKSKQAAARSTEDSDDGDPEMRYTTGDSRIWKMAEFKIDVPVIPGVLERRLRVCAGDGYCDGFTVSQANPTLYLSYHYPDAYDASRDYYGQGPTRQEALIHVVDVDRNQSHAMVFTYDAHPLSPDEQYCVDSHGYWISWGDNQGWCA